MTDKSTSVISGAVSANLLISSMNTMPLLAIGIDPGMSAAWGFCGSVNLPRSTLPRIVPNFAPWPISEKGIGDASCWSGAISPDWLWVGQ